MTTTQTTDPLRGFRMRELADELVTRVGPEGACRLVQGPATIDELPALADEYDKLGLKSP